VKRAKKRFGQHFLHDPGTIDRIVRAIAPSAGERIVEVGPGRGAITLPLEVTDMDDRVVWLPLNSAGNAVHQTLGVGVGAVVSIGRGQL